MSLLEVILVIVVLGLLLWPILLLVKGLESLKQDLSKHAKLESWHTLQEQAVGQGLHPDQGAFFAAGPSIYFTGLPLETVSGDALAASSLISVSSLLLPMNAALQRSSVEGLVLTASPASPPVAEPPQGLRDIVLQPPQLSPSPGASLLLSSVTEEQGQFFFILRSQAPETEAEVVGCVFGTERRDYGNQNELRMPVSQLLSGNLGTLWCEFAGASVPGALSSSLSDGRLQWLVAEPAGARRYQPSSFVHLSYNLDLGAPVLILEGTEYATGSTVDVDYRTLLRVRMAEQAPQLTWPMSLRSLLNRGGFVVDYGFQLRFEGRDQSAASGLRGLFQEESLVWWSALSVVQAQPSLAEHVQASSGTWYLRRRVLSLPMPERAGDETVVYDGGLIHFEIPPVDNIGALGRLSARDGSVLSTGPELSLEVLP